MTPFRRKLKLLKYVLTLFLIFLVIEIYKDYQVLNLIQDSKTTSLLFSVNSSTNTQRLKTLLDEATTNLNLPRLNLKLRKIYASTGIIPTETEIQENRNETQTAKQQNVFVIIVDQVPNNDSRQFYNPSFKNKMEEALRQEMESVEVAANGPVIALEGSKEEGKNIRTEAFPPSSMENALIPNKGHEGHPKTGENDPPTPRGIKGKPPPPNTKNLPRKKDGGNPPKDSKDPKDLVPKATRTLIENMRKLRMRVGKLSAEKPQTKVVKSTKKVFKVSHVVDLKEISLNETEMKRIEDQIHDANRRQLIHNQPKFGHLQNNDTVILIQVHNRLSNLELLVSSLREVKHLRSTLVIFSHDFWDDSINRFVRSIKDFRVLQIFFPYSIQLNPKSFPGRDPRDCLWNSDKIHVAKSQCLNRLWPDSYGHFREASFPQLKHHWWWKLFRVFDHLEELRNFTGQVLFLEEDHYVMPDLLHTLRLLQKERDKNYRDHLVLALGNYEKKTSIPTNAVERGEWLVNKYNLGFAFDRRVFELVRGCGDDFCSYDDYNWDWTISSLAKGCAKGKLTLLSIKLPRVFHIGSCGTHIRQKNCNLSTEVNLVKARIKVNAGTLFPTSLIVAPKFKTFAKPKKSNGGWGDLRDKKLCLAISQGKDIDAVLDRLQFRNVTTR